jgi:hypothetical protein
MRVAGIDLSMTSTGVAVLGVSTFIPAWPPTFKLERIRSAPDRKAIGPPSLAQRNKRITEVRDAVLSAADLWATEPGQRPGLILLEAPSFGSEGAGMWDRAWLWGQVVTAIHEQGIPLVEVTPHQVRKYATGSASTRGKTKVDKDQVLAAVIRRYVHAPVDGNDVADALILAAIGARMLGHPIEAALPVANTAALDKLHLPEGQ